ncbi:protein-hormone receptor activity protein [Homalodisca vitripennis]|nr:protein-hormone receptor activity protein [Homalodisca vitripennis]
MVLPVSRSVSGNRIKYIPAGVLQHSRGLALLELRGNPLVGVDPHAFSFLPKLRKLILSDAKDLSEFPSLNGTSALEILRLDRASLHTVPTTLCQTCPKLKSLDLKSNRIVSLEGRMFQGLSLLHDLLLSHNLINAIPQDAFHGLEKLQVL